MPWKNCHETSWKKYLEWNKLTHLTEVVSLDGILNEPLVEPDYDDPDDWNYPPLKFPIVINKNKFSEFSSILKNSFYLILRFLPD